MTTARLACIEDTNLSHAWAKVFVEAMKRPKSNPAPVVITLTGFVDGLPVEDLETRQELDKTLTAMGKNSTRVSSLMIFPYDQWVRKGRPPRDEFFTWCVERFAPRLKARDPRNRRGLYFERMMRHPAGAGTHTYDGNQLKHIIDLWYWCQDHGKRPRQSALQVACFAPHKDHNLQPRQGFPCLQQVSFTYDNSGGMAVSAYYPTQYIFDRGYGNYLGLCHLGAFMAHELGLELVRLNCFVARVELGDVNKEGLQELLQFVAGKLPGSGA